MIDRNVVPGCRKSREAIFKKLYQALLTFRRVKRLEARPNVLREPCRRSQEGGTKRPGDISVSTNHESENCS